MDAIVSIDLMPCHNSPVPVRAVKMDQVQYCDKKQRNGIVPYQAAAVHTWAPHRHTCDVRATVWSLLMRIRVQVCEGLFYEVFTSWHEQGWNRNSFFWMDCIFVACDKFYAFFFSFTPSFFQPARFVFSFYVSNGCRLVALPFPWMHCHCRVRWAIVHTTFFSNWRI